MIAVGQYDNAAENAKKATGVGVKVVVAFHLEMDLLSELIHAQN